VWGTAVRPCEPPASVCRTAGAERVPHRRWLFWSVTELPDTLPISPTRRRQEMDRRRASLLLLLAFPGTIGNKTPFLFEFGANAGTKRQTSTCMLPFEGSEVYMHEPRLPLPVAAACRPHFAILSAWLVFADLPFVAQQKPIPAGFSFLNQLRKPCRISYDPWTEPQIPQGNAVDAGLASGCAESIGSFPSSLPARRRRRPSSNRPPQFLKPSSRPQEVFPGWVRCPIRDSVAASTKHIQ